MTIEEIRKLHAQATKGPWVGDRSDGSLKYHLLGANGEYILQVDHKNDTSGFLFDNGDADEAFVIASWEAVRVLLEELEKSDREIARLKAEVEELRDANKAEG